MNGPRTPKPRSATTATDSTLPPEAADSQQAPDLEQRSHLEAASEDSGDVWDSTAQDWE
ncbi:MAG: hypothetical protein RL655_2018, partial [Pseudomonadota bacterium]